MTHCYFCHDSLDESVTFYTGPTTGQRSVFGKPVHRVCADFVYAQAEAAYFDADDFVVPTPEQCRKHRHPMPAKDYTNGAYPF